MKTTSYEISKKLKEAGFETETSKSVAMVGTIDYPSYDLETLINALPDTTEIIINNYTGKRIFYLGSNIRGNEISITIEKNESLADTAGKMWLMLKEKGIIC